MAQLESHPNYIIHVTLSLNNSESIAVKFDHVAISGNSVAAPRIANSTGGDEHEAFN